MNISSRIRVSNNRQIRQVCDIFRIFFNSAFTRDSYLKLPTPAGIIII